MLRRFSLSDFNSEEKTLFALLCFVTVSLPIAANDPQIYSSFNSRKLAEAKASSFSVARPELTRGENAQHTELAENSVASENESMSIPVEGDMREPIDDAGVVAVSSSPIADEDEKDALQPNSPKIFLDDVITPIQYSLPESTGKEDGTEKETPGSIKIRKSVSFGNKPAGTALITVDSSSRLLMDAKDVRDLLMRNPASEAYLKQLPQSGLLSFQTMRSMGIDMRYNPTTDTVLVNLD